MLKQSPQSLGWTRTGRAMYPIEAMLWWHPDAKDPEGRYCAREAARGAITKITVLSTDRPRQAA